MDNDSRIFLVPKANNVLLIHILYIRLKSQIQTFANTFAISLPY
jgi:hypothetical protein